MAKAKRESARAPRVKEPDILKCSKKSITRRGEPLKKARNRPGSRAMYAATCSPLEPPQRGVCALPPFACE